MTSILCPEPDSFSTRGLELAASRVNLVARYMNQATFETVAPDFDAVLIRFNTRVSGELLQRAPRIKSILSPTTGLDHIDIICAKRLGVKVFHLNGQKRFLESISATAELTIALILASLRKLPLAVDAVRSGKWDPGPFRGYEASGKVMGLVGCGRLGRKVARVGLALGMRVVAYDPRVGRFPSGVERATSLRELLSLADILTLHVPLLPETVHLIGASELAYMKPNSILINTARGAVVDTRAMLEALNSGRLAAAAIDVVEGEESILKGDRHCLIDYARKNDNLIITPHIGGATYESVEKTDLFILNQYFKILNGYNDI